jgi:hypothetical protein
MSNLGVFFFFNVVYISARWSHTALCISLLLLLSFFTRFLLFGIGLSSDVLA